LSQHVLSREQESITSWYYKNWIPAKLVLAGSKRGNMRE